jgi:hypothetical protein
MTDAAVSAISTEQLCNHLRESEGKIVNVRVSVQYRAKEEIRPGVWVDQTEAELTAVFDNNVGGKFKVDFQRNKGRVENAPIPYLTESHIDAYNGRVGQHLQRNSGRESTGWIGNESPARNYPNLASGRIFTSPGIAERLSELKFTGDYKTNSHENQPLSAIIEDFAKHTNMGLRIVDGVKNGARIIGVEMQGSKESNRYTVNFDPARGYVPIEYVEELGNSIICTHTVDELEEVKPGIFYPKKATYKAVRTRKAGKLCDDLATCCATEIVVNDPELKDAVFNIDWPSGTVIFDKVSGQNIVVSPPDDALMKSLDKNVLDAQEQLDKPVAAKSESEKTADITNGIAPKMVASPTRSRSWIWPFVAMAFAGLGVCGLMYALRRKQ